MESFRWISVVLSMLLGLGVARLLSGGVAAFRSRQQAHLDWLPLVWAACIFVSQLQYWWALLELPYLVTTWTFASFVSLVSLTLLLFVAAALVLPAEPLAPSATLRDNFARDGRWALVALSCYAFGSLVADALYWGASPFTALGAGIALMGALPLICFALRSRRGQVLTTVVYVPVMMWVTVAASPRAY